MTLLKTSLPVLALILCGTAAFAYDPPTSPEEVNAWETQAKKGDADAQYNLGRAYLRGDMVNRDAQEAYTWLLRSGNAGNTDAEIVLGFLFRGGDGIPMDKVSSYMWFEIANRNGDPTAYELRNNVAWTMTEPEIRNARAKADAWSRSTYVEVTPEGK